MPGPLLSGLDGLDEHFVTARVRSDLAAGMIQRTHNAALHAASEADLQMCADLMELDR